MATTEQIQRAGWPIVGRLPDGRLMGELAPDSPADPPAYGVIVDGAGEAVEGVTILHRPSERECIVAPRIPTTAVPTPEQAAGMHEEAMARQHHAKQPTKRG